MAKAGRGRPHPSVRLIFDEQTSSKVAKSLAALGFNVSWVGGPGQPARGSTDETVLDHAMRCNQIVVTANHDFIVLCCDRGEAVVWLDGRGTSLTFTQTVLRCFDQIEEWQHEIERRGAAVCVQSFKTKVRVLQLADARRIALDRNRARLRRERRHAKRRESAGQESLS